MADVVEASFFVFAVVVVGYFSLRFTHENRSRVRDDYFYLGEKIGWKFSYSDVIRVWGDEFPEHPVVKRIDIDSEGRYMIVFDLLNGKTVRMFAGNFEKITLV